MRNFDMRLSWEFLLLQGQALASLGLHRDLILLVFTMVDRDDSDSGFAPFWRSLPTDLITGMLTSACTCLQAPGLPLLAGMRLSKCMGCVAGLNAPEQEISMLEGTPAHAVFQEARQVQAVA